MWIIEIHLWIKLPVKLEIATNFECTPQPAIIQMTNCNRTFERWLLVLWKHIGNTLLIIEIKWDFFLTEIPQ